MSDIPSHRTGPRTRLRVGLAFVIIGLFLFTIGADPGLIGMDLSPVVGFVQIAVMMVGLAMICAGGYTSLNTLWEGREKSITADIGYRLVSTGYVVAAASAMADVFGFGSQPFPAVPYFGQWQAMGVMAGEIVIILGFILMTPKPPAKYQPPTEAEIFSQ